MGNVTKSQQNNITSPNGNSLAVFVEGTTGVMKVKDVMGNIQPLSDFIVSPEAQSFNPLFTDASGTTTGAVATGSYTMISPKICFFRVYVDFASCTNFGTGQYQISLPFPSIETMRQAGGTLHQVTGNSLYHIAGITDIIRGGATLQQLNDGQLRINNNVSGPLSSSTDNAIRLVIANYAATTNGGKPFDLYGGYIGSDSSKQIMQAKGRIKTTSAITQLDFVAGSNWTAGTVKIYGVK